MYLSSLTIVALCAWSGSLALVPSDRLFSAALAGFEEPPPTVFSVLKAGNGHVQPKDGNDHVQPKEDYLSCGKTYTLAPGATVLIASKNYPNKYPNNARCRWTFKAISDDSTLSIVCNSFIVKKTRYCRRDFLKLEDGDSLNKKYCGSTPVSAESTTGVLKAYFKSNRKGNAKGFQCSVMASGDAVTTTSTVDPSDPATTTSPPSNSECKCGVVNEVNRIVGGVKTGVHEFPWQVALVSSSGKRPYCGASIISDRWILTAAHCVDGNTASGSVVVIGEHNYASTADTTATERRTIAQVISHPKYNSRTLDNDIALLRLESPIIFKSDNLIAPVCMPEAVNLFDDVPATITGWGTTSAGGSQPKQLMEVTVPTMTNSKCTNKYGQGEITDNMICAGTDTGGKDSCQGDSGGPMVTSGNAAETFMVQIGVVSWGYGCADARYPGVYTRVNKYLDWMSDVTSGSGATSCPAGVVSGR